MKVTLLAFNGLMRSVKDFEIPDSQLGRNIYLIMDQPKPKIFLQENMNDFTKAPFMKKATFEYDSYFAADIREKERKYYYRLVDVS